MRCEEYSKLPKAVNLEMIRCVKVDMSNGDSYTVKQDDLVAIQFIKDNKQILVRRGRIKDLVVINRRELSKQTDNVSHIILDCSEQFTVKIIEIKFSDIIKIGSIDDEFYDYNDRIAEIKPNFIEGDSYPVREGGLVTEDESKSTNQTPITPRGFAVTK